MSLPIHILRDELLALVADRSAQPLQVILEAPTGSGKSTQIPQYLLEAKLPGEIVVLQPRRIAARLLAKRVAWERKSQLGGEVGYQIRFENNTSRDTRLRFVTEGILLRQILADPALRGVSAVILDEFHERNLYTDLALARLRQLQEEGRRDLVLVIMSATLQTEKLGAYLPKARVLRSQGRTFPVAIRQVRPAPRPANARSGPPTGVWDDAARACETLILTEKMEGDTLVFMPGGFEIRKTMAALQNCRWAKGFDILPLYSDLPPVQQDRALTPGERPRIIVATNVAETSLTIDGVTMVVDSGLARVSRFDQRRGLNTLLVEKISRSAATQRAGRAGRTAPGLCVRLWDEADQAARAEEDEPEILRIDLAETLLFLKAGGVHQWRDFPWFERPSEAALSRGEDLLQALGALDHGGKLTATGRRMATLPLPPRLSRLLLAASESGCMEEAALCAAFLQARPLFARQGAPGGKRPEDWAERGDASDFQPLLRAFHAARAANFDLGACEKLGVHSAAAREVASTADALLRQMRGAKKPGATAAGEQAQASSNALWKAVLSSFPDQVAVEKNAGMRVFQLVGNRSGKLAADSVIRGEKLIVSTDLMEIEGKSLAVQLAQNTAVREEWLRECFPEGELQTLHDAVWDAVNKRVIRRETLRFRDLDLRSREAGEPEAGAAAEILAALVVKGDLALEHWNENVEQWIARVNGLAGWMPELELPVIGEEDRTLIVAQICHGATFYKQIRERPVLPVLHSWLSGAQRRALDDYAPERITLKNGLKAKITYAAGADPSIAVVLQKLYDVNETPRIAAGRVPLRVHILSPAQRPIQVTKDLAHFWKESYPAVKTQWRGRYPRQEWR